MAGVANPSGPLYGNFPTNVSPSQVAGTNALNQQGLALATGAQAGDYSLQQQKLANTGQIGAATASAAPGLLSAQNQQARFNQLFPYFQGLASQAGVGAGGNSPSSNISQATALAGGAGYQAPGGGGAVGNYGYGTAQAPPPPSIPSASVGAPPSIGGLAPAISGNQLQANINLNNAQNWAQAGGESRRQTNQLAGGGLGATSPLARALQAQTFGGALAANNAGATNAQMQAAQLNAQQALGAYQSQNSALASMYGSQVGAQAGEYAARTGAQANEYGSQVGANASMYGSGLDYQAALAQVAASKQNAILQALANFST